MCLSDYRYWLASVVVRQTLSIVREHFFSKTIGQIYNKFGMHSICGVKHQEIKREAHGPHRSSEKPNQ